MKYDTKLKLMKKEMNRYKARQERLVCLIKERMGYRSPELRSLIRVGLLVDERGFISNFDEWAKEMKWAIKDAQESKEKWTSKAYI